jgi:hypothetical protein
MARIIASVLFLLIASISTAQTVYQSTDKHGNPVFTDQPQPSAKAVELKPINTTPSVAPTTAATPETPAFKGYSKVALAVPSSIPNGLAPTTVGIMVEPQLRPGHIWLLSLDGKPLTQGEGASATIGQMERGSHQLLLQIVDGQSNVIGASAPTDVFVYWPSKNR